MMHSHFSPFLFNKRLNGVVVVVLRLSQWLLSKILSDMTELRKIHPSSLRGCGSRSQQSHTVSQVVVGAVLGSIFCILWLWSFDAFVLQAFDSSLWVRMVVVLGAAGFCLRFLVHVVRNWFRDKEEFSNYNEIIN
ncbi:lipid phosphate phosphatase epsilon 1, chloroplastic-like [Carya illinoinensis]|uniref:lipid phosphate phosphatase epsilon 1, chloroplastic-like n=1 Tax=Carya illinoinensis TaxID=32201 RepID=UPI001C7225A0|nr:lipid phosphate phosphatase epsilon 1, chloroplastic-like [Carya illinoinensis]